MDVGGLTELFNNFALPIVMLIVFIVGIVYMYKDNRDRDAKHDAEMKEMTDKYYVSYLKVNESNLKVTDALNNNTKVIEKLLDKFN